MHHLFLDESGDHSLTHIDCGYPVFVLGGILVEDDLRLAALERSVAAFKDDFFGDHGVVLHTAGITRNRRGFECLAAPGVRDDFHHRLNALLASLEFSVVACVIRKRALVERHGELAVAWDLLRLNGTRYVRPEVLRRRSPKGEWEGAGLVVLPKEVGRGPLRNTRPRPV